MARLKENVLASGFVAMTEDELYEVNGGRMIRDDPRERPEELHKDYDRTQKETVERHTTTSSTKGRVDFSWREGRVSVDFEHTKKETTEREKRGRDR